MGLNVEVAGDIECGIIKYHRLGVGKIAVMIKAEIVTVVVKESASTGLPKMITWHGLNTSMNWLLLKRALAVKPTPKGWKHCTVAEATSLVPRG